MLPTYNNLPFARVQSLASFYKDSSSLPETPKLRSLIENAKLLFSLPSSRVILECAEGERVYRITLLTTDVKRQVFGFMIYVPSNRQLDIYDVSDPEIPFLQFRAKKAVFKNYSHLLDKAGLDTLFTKLSNVL